ncbi:DNA cytosine methyltransferase [Salmonella enterica subsp. enterica serovar Isangi]|uniref:DNA cytosine methyltransferase n=1 Tax=Salmonella enterica TaxID=28901 RepID=UPI001079BC65|nr:DNA cytosine methyltransferase [Salmonella enterica]EBF6654648.1 DNA cytosine methyltransferase [Salmonella enterica subsp. enterica serovar Infantis]EBS0090852.1 DNA cytosine methyltransferase [Salmonella enterica subsp. enterica serovar Tennessee]EBW1710884.1 DNA cytosine methyltransferase [Salmonella enterica subsp. enterica serovar Livingstone]EBW2699273.1 DNA cytosine methyltransferase [Salmonella enterica subsp. enterica serovar Galiema]EBZ5858816.1 DNA cytosine methyltransferase [Sal
MKPTAYYNEIDPFAAQWLRNLIAGGHIAPGEVDERSIEDVTPDDLRGFTQCHFFAGIGVWSHSLRLAGWPDDKPVWTGSCPCQPFSAAGKGDGFADERHLWPHFFHLISERRPQHVFGEQVASGNANSWFDLVQADLEGVGYAFGLVPFTSAGVGAPHIRERAYWVAHASGWRHDGRTETSGQKERTCPGAAVSDCVSWLGNANVTRLERLGGNDGATGWEGATGSATTPGVHDGMAYADNQQYTRTVNGRGNEHVPTGREQDAAAPARLCGDYRPLEVNGFWRDADWLLCRDGKWRPVEPGTFPLVDGAAARLGRVEPGVARVASSNRVGRLKGYGNAINAQAAAEFIRACMGGI